MAKGIYISLNQESEDEDSAKKKDPQKEFERELRHTTSHEISHHFFGCRNNVQNAFAIVRTSEEGLHHYDYELPGDIIAFFKDDDGAGLKDLNEALMSESMGHRYVGLKKIIRYIVLEPGWSYDYGEKLGENLLVLSGGDYNKTYKALRLMGNKVPFEQAAKTSYGLESLSDKDFRDHVLRVVRDRDFASFSPEI